MIERALREVVDEIRHRFKECGSIAFWGGLLVWPHDAFYSLVEVRETSEGFLLILRHDDGSLHELEVSEPRGVEVTDETTLSVQTAARLRFNSGVRTPSGAEKPPALLLS